MSCDIKDLDMKNMYNFYYGRTFRMVVKVELHNLIRFCCVHACLNDMMLLNL